MNKRIAKKLTSLIAAATAIVSLIPSAYAEVEDIPANGLGDVIYSAEKGMFVMAGKPSIYSSADGENWIKRNCPVTTAIGGNGSKGITYSEKADAFLMAPTAKCLLYSKDGVFWEKIATGAFANNVNTVTAFGDYVYVTDLKGNVLRARYDNLESFTTLEQDIKTTQWRGACAYDDKVFFYSTAAWESVCKLALYENGSFSEPQIEKLSTNDIHRIYDMIYSESLKTFVMIYAVAGNNYKDSYIAVYENGRFRTVGSVIDSGISIEEAENGFVIGTIVAGKIYKLEKDKLMSFSAGDIKEIPMPEEITDKERFFNIATSGDKTIVIGGAGGNVILLDKELNPTYIKKYHTEPTRSGIKITGADSVIFRKSEGLREIMLSCNYVDQSGIEMPGEGALCEWGIKDVIPEEASGGIAIDENGALAIEAQPEYEEITFTVTATADGKEAERTFTAKKPQVAGSVVITGNTELEIPMTRDTAEYIFKAIVLDTNGVEIEDAAVIWSVTEAEGIAMTDGVLTVNKGTAEGEYTVTASCEYVDSNVSGTYKISLREENVPTSVVWKEEQTLFAPTEGEEEYAFTVMIKNQKGEEYTAATAILPGGEAFPDGISYSDGKLIVSDAAADGSYSIKAQLDGGFEAPVGVTVDRLAITVSGETKVDIKGKDELLTYTAEVTDSNGKEVPGELVWSVSDGACNIDEEGNLYIPASIRSSTEVEITAGRGKLATDTVVLTIYNTKKTTGGGGGGGGGSSVVIAPSTANVPTETVAVPKEEEKEEKKEFPFVDMENAVWAKEAVMALFEKGIVTGVTDSTFEPARNITRAEFIKLLCDLLAISNTSTDPGFADCGEADWYYKYVLTAYNSGIVKGMGSDFFGARLPLSRQDMAKMLEGVLNSRKVNLDTSKDFADMDKADSYAIDAIKKLIGKGVLSGDESGSFRPKDYTTRAEAAVVINNLGGYIR